MKQTLRFEIWGALAPILMGGLWACKPLKNEGGKVFDIGPARECTWIYSSEGLPAFKNALTHPGFDLKHNPSITVSRRSFTARVVGTLPDEFVQMHGGMEGVVRKFPWVTPLRQTADHLVEPEDPKLEPAERPARGKIVKTSIRTLPDNSIMIVYPVAVASAGYNTLAGNWSIQGKARAVPYNAKLDAAFGNFPYLPYSSAGHAFHGPIEASPNGEWRVRRGAVSHGCQRMQGEHILELAVLLRCKGRPTGSSSDCPEVSVPSREAVTVTEEYDFIPSPDLADNLPEGEYLGSWDEVLAKFIGIDVDYPASSTLVNAGILLGKRGVELKATLTHRAPRNGNGDLHKPFVHLRVFPTWDARVTRLAWGEGPQCR